MFRRTRYQHGSVEREERKKGPAVWVYRWWEEDINGKLLHRKIRVGDVKKYPTESAVHAAADALRLTINNRCEHQNLRRTTINTLWEHYSQEEHLSKLSPPRMRTSFTQKTGLSHVGAICPSNKSRRSRWSDGYERPEWRMGPKPRSSA